jgi:hypothetical protein
MKHIEISLMENGELSIDGQTKPGGNLDIREFEDGEWVGVVVMPAMIIL